MFVNAFYSTMIFSIESQKVFACETVLEGPIGQTIPLDSSDYNMR